MSLGDLSTAQVSAPTDHGDRRPPTEMLPPLRIAAQDQPPQGPGRPDGRGTGPWL